MAQSPPHSLPLLIVAIEGINFVVISSVGIHMLFNTTFQCCCHTQEVTAHTSASYVGRK